ncbi:MAG: F0F1 ATP synthase subunit B [Bacteroidales bacterium]|nr:F0F1 ATP synthase subunit B [Bacteroidales bacterium]
MELIKPEVGLLFWMVLSFSIVFFILKKAAWKPVLTALKDRESTIENALSAADKAKKEMEQLQADNQRIIDKARKERDQLIKEAREAKDKMMEEARTRAMEEANKLIATARQNIQQEKEAAIEQIKVQVANLSVEIAEKILEKELSSKVLQDKLIEDYMKDLRIN